MDRENVDCIGVTAITFECLICLIQRYMHEVQKTGLYLLLQSVWSRILIIKYIKFHPEKRLRLVRRRKSSNVSLLLAAERISQTKVFQDPISLCGMAHWTVITPFKKMLEIPPGDAHTKILCVLIFE